jgi:hypothetical protein
LRRCGEEAQKCIGVDGADRNLLAVEPEFAIRLSQNAVVINPCGTTQPRDTLEVASELCSLADNIPNIGG